MLHAKKMSSSHFSRQMLWVYLLGSFGLLGSLPYVSTVTADFSAPISSGTGEVWQRLIHLGHNSFASWYLDPLIVALIEIFNTTGQAFAPTAGLVFVFWSGTLWLLATYLPKQSPNLSGLFSLALSLSLPFLFGADRLLFSALAWCPWLITALIRTFRASSNVWLWILVVIFFTFRLNQACQQFAPTALALVFIFSLVLEPNNFGIRRTWGVLCGAMLFTGLCFLSFIGPAFPDYPQFAQVQAVSPFFEVTYPHLGPGSPIPILNENYLSQAYFWPCAWLILVFGICLRGKFDTRANVLLLALASVLVGCLESSSWREIGPLAVLARTLPGSWSVSLLPLAFCLVLLASLIELQRRRKFLAGIMLLAGLWILPQLLSAGQLLGRFIQPELTRGLNFINQKQDSDTFNLAKILASPSYPIINSYHSLGLNGLDILRRQAEFTGQGFRPLAELKPRLLTSSKSRRNKVDFLLDSNPGTRWSPGVGRQTGQEWLFATWAEPVKISALDLNCGFYKSDFPRGLRISASAACPEILDAKTKPSLEIQVGEIQSWPGSLKFTSDGFPYYAHDAEVRLVFSKPVVTNCFLIEQTGQDDKYDWSVAEILLRYMAASH